MKNTDVPDPGNEWSGTSPLTSRTPIDVAARALASEQTVMDTLQRIVNTANQTIEGCSGAGILLVERHRMVVGAWSSDLVRRAEEMEFEVGEGPCVDALWMRPLVESPDLRDQISIWPNFAQRAIDMGIESMLAFRLFSTKETLGALDLYSTQRGVFDETTRAFASVFAGHAALALAGAQVHERDLATADGLREALASRDLIGQAKGILMASRKIDADTAFELLRNESQKQNVKVRLIAEQVVAAGNLTSA